MNWLKNWRNKENALKSGHTLFDREEKAGRIRAIEEEAGNPIFWGKPEKAQQKMQELGKLKDQIAFAEKLGGLLEEWEVLLQLYEEAERDGGKDEGACGLLNEAEKIEADVASLLDGEELRLLFNGRYDENNAILALHPGTGGLEAQDWTGMLLRMYTRWAEKKGYVVELLDLLPGEEAGIKSVTFLVQGEKAYGYLQAERGVHRLVRISPFDAGGRRHTSFASVDVLPEVKEGIDIVLDPEEIRIDTFRSRGAGGQHVNTTDSAVRITHLPTGIVVQCQNERSQHSNREKATRILLAKLADLAQQQHREELFSIRGEQKEITWGSQIRSYIFQPYSLVKDHRTGVEAGNIQAVMDGEIGEFLEAYLRYNSGRDEKAEILG